MEMDEREKREQQERLARRKRMQEETRRKQREREHQDEPRRATLCEVFYHGLSYLPVINVTSIRSFSWSTTELAASASDDGLMRE